MPSPHGLHETAFGLIAILATSLPLAALGQTVIRNPLTASEPTSVRGVLATPQSAAPETPTKPPTVVGFGRGVPLSSAMHDIVPPGTTVRFSAGASPRTKVDWTGGASWQDTVQSVARTAGYRASLDATGNVLITGNGASPPSTEAAAQPRRLPPIAANPRPLPPKRRVVASSTSNQATGTSAYDSPTIDEMTPTQIALATPGAAQPNEPLTRRSRRATANTDNLSRPTEDDPMATRYSDQNSRNTTGTWPVRDGATLLQTLQAWCAKAGGGWKVFPKTSVNYVLHGSMVFQGTLEQAVVDLINAVHADPAPYANVHPRSRQIILTDSEHNSISTAME